MLAFAGKKSSLVRCFFYHKLDVANQMLQAGADPNANIDPNDDLPLIAAVRTGTLEAVKLLLDYGADINAID